MKEKTLNEKVREMFYEGIPTPTTQPAWEETASPITVGSSVWYRLPGQPEKGPCQVTSLNDLGSILVQIEESGELVWVHRCLITKVEEPRQ